MAIEHSFLHKKKEYKVQDLKLIDMLQEGEASTRWKDLLVMFAEENLYDAVEIINQFPNEMDLMIRDEMKGRKLESLKFNLLD